MTSNNDSAAAVQIKINLNDHKSLCVLVLSDYMRVCYKIIYLYSNSKTVNKSNLIKSPSAFIL